MLRGYLHLRGHLQEETAEKGVGGAWLGRGHESNLGVLRNGKFSEALTRSRSRIHEAMTSRTDPVCPGVTVRLRLAVLAGQRAEQLTMAVHNHDKHCQDEVSNLHFLDARFGCQNHRRSLASYQIWQARLI